MYPPAARQTSCVFFLPFGQLEFAFVCLLSSASEKVGGWVVCSHACSLTDEPPTHPLNHPCIGSIHARNRRVWWVAGAGAECFWALLLQKNSCRITPPSQVPSRCQADTCSATVTTTPAPLQPCFHQHAHTSLYLHALPPPPNTPSFTSLHTVTGVACWWLQARPHHCDGSR